MTSQKKFILCDGNEAASDISYRLSEMAVIYPITPSSPMGEYAEAWAAKGNKNIFGNVPEVNMMQSEAGAIGAVHGALQMGALATTYTASQGLLLMIPNMYKIAGELTPFVMHVAARTIATHALSIFGDHSDVMACRQTGFAMLASNSVQEAHDLALVSHIATLETRVPFMHFFDGFRTSHEISKIERIDDSVLKAMTDMSKIEEKRQRSLTPENPAIRGTAQNPDIFFQASEARNKYYNTVEEEVQKAMDAVAKHTGRKYDTVDFYGAEDAEKVIVAMGSGVETVKETVDHMNANGEKVALLNVRLYRPFPVETFAKKLPATAKKIAVLDRTKELGAIGEPLYLDVLGALMEKGIIDRTVIGGRYGLSSKEFTPAMVKAVYDELDAETPKKEFTVGINDDVTHLSLTIDEHFKIEEADDVKSAIFYGLGSDGTVGANKNSIKIIAEEADKYGQAYFVYDSKKSGSFTTSHLRFSDNPIKSQYLIGNEKADFVACHHFPIIGKWDILEKAKHGATLLINSPYKKEALWKNLPNEVQVEIMEKDIQVYAINAGVVARDIGLGRRTNTIMQVCFFHLAQVIESGQAITAIKKFIEKSYLKKGRDVVELNWKAVDASIENLYKVEIDEVNGESMADIIEDVNDTASLAVKNVAAHIMRDKGDDLPVSVFNVDGTFETATTKYEKRCIAADVPIWDPELCIQCGKCAIVCPHAAIRTKAYDENGLENAPEGFKSADYKTPELGGGLKFTVQTSPKDCTGCGLCVSNCPAKSKTEEGKKAINMTPIQDVLEVEDTAWNHFETIPYIDRAKLNPVLGKHTQLMQPLFEFSGACAGCGETAYVKLVTQLFGDRMVIANATGCSSIYGGNLPTTPYAKNAEGYGPAWSNSLFEDNAEYGFGMRLAMDKYINDANMLLVELKDELGSDMVEKLMSEVVAGSESSLQERRADVAELKVKLAGIKGDKAVALLEKADYLVPKSMWMFGGDGWAYDIGYGGLDHVINMNRNVNILVMDTEAYSNTGGQMSKATPKGAIAKFATTGKETNKKDLGAIAMASGNCYVAKIALGANEAQMIKAFREAEAYDGPSLIIAYSPCVAHGYDLGNGLDQQKKAVKSGHWDMYRYNPALIEQGKNPLQIDTPLHGSEAELKEYVAKENRYRALSVSSPERFGELIAGAADDNKIKKARLDLLKELHLDSETDEEA